MEKVLSKPIKFDYWVKTIPTLGNLAWEYNPFKNYRLTNPVVYYDGLLYEGFLEFDRYSFNIKNTKYYFNSGKLIDNVWGKENERTISDFIYYKPGSLIDFDTSELNFDLEHPVDILPQYSYDGSVNLILNDGVNSPKLINSRFSPIGRNKYRIVDRTGVSDTNIYDLGDLFNLDTSLYKKTLSIPRLKYLGASYGGNLPVGNYHFYFKFMDADGNTTDFIAESGLVSLFIGSIPSGIKSGFRNENSNKLVAFYLSNIDSAYPYLQVYYTRATSDIRLNYVKEVVKINKKFPVNGTQGCSIIINGSEETEIVPSDELNVTYNNINDAATQAMCLNRLFLGNIHTSELNYKELLDLALRFTPLPTEDQYEPYTDRSKLYSYYDVSLDSYYNDVYIYNKVGYWPNEYYRLGVVFMLNDNTLSPVFNIRGCTNIDSNFTWDEYDIYNEDGNRVYIKIDEESKRLIREEKTTTLENAAGVVSFKETTYNQIIGIKILYNEELLNVLKKFNVSGFFFVRQTRIPITLCQALTIATDNISHTPMLRTKDGPLKQAFLYKKGTETYITERFINNLKELDSRFEKRLYHSSFRANIKTNAAICPEYVVNQAYLNSFFTGDELNIVESHTLPENSYLTFVGRHLYNDSYVFLNDTSQILTKVIGVPDSTELVGLDMDNLFSSKAGNEKEAHRFEFILTEFKTNLASNFLRGNFGSYIGFNKNLENNKIINIQTKTSPNELLIRMLDNSAYFAISDRYSIEDIIKEKEIPTVYRGDCYWCQFTHRIIRNFNSSSSPYNDIVVNSNTFKDNIIYDDGMLNQEKLANINVGDLNAVELGLWVTFSFRSSINLNIRGVDSSYIQENSESQNPRSFYPLIPMSTDGTFKIPESECFNDGLKVSVSEKYNFKLDDTIPYLKNEFSNRILYSEIYVNDSFENGCRVFKSSNYRDYSKTYGSITKLIEKNGNLLCVFEHGVGLIPVNERSIATNGDGGYAYINTSNVLPENIKVLSDSFGSLWKDSVIKTDQYIYGIDTIAKKIWRTDGYKFECISDFRIQKFLNENISLGERELTPLIGIRNVKSFYNAYKKDVLFTFYDNLLGFEEKVWNICYNEIQNLFTTFYSWVPSLMENIDNIPFSFDRNTAKWISKISNSKIIDKNIIPEIALNCVGMLSLPEGLEVELFILCKDIWGNYNNYYISGPNDSMYDEPGWRLVLKLLYYYEMVTILHYRKGEDELKKEPPKQDLYLDELELYYTELKEYIDLPIYINLLGKQEYLPKELLRNSDKIVQLLNIRAILKNGTSKDYTIAVIPEYNIQFLTTDFWKHGQAGIIDITEDIYPTYWYGKQHPFEFEFVVVDNPQVHKIFTNLELIANKAKPESFHFEIVGECYDFNNDKPNMYYRQEAMKALCLYKGLDISYNRDFVKVPLKRNVKSADFPRTYFARKDAINDVEDSYVKTNKECTNITGAELVYYPNRQEYRIWQHQNANCLDDLDLNNARSILKANCKYQEDRWKVQINPIKIAYKNEDWEDKPPFTTKNVAIPDKSITITAGETILDPSNLLHNVELSNIDDKEWTYRKELDLKDKFIKVRIRYSGEELAIIDFINTIYNISYS